MATPNMMPKSIILDTAIIVVREADPERDGYDVYDSQFYITEQVRVVGFTRPTELDKANERKHAKFMAECDARDGLVPSITRERGYKAARRAAGIRGK